MQSSWTCVGLAALLLSASLTPTPAQAGVVNGAHITYITSNVNGVLVFYTDGTPSARPSCATADGWSINITTSAGQAVAATVHTAMAAGMKVDVQGLSVCNQYSTVESLSYVAISR